MTTPTTERQPREHPVPCKAHGFIKTDTGVKPRVLTSNHDALCDDCQGKD